MNLRTIHHAARWGAVAALLVLAGCAAYPAEPGPVAGYCDDPAWCSGLYPDGEFGVYEFAGGYPFYHGWGHHHDGFHHVGGVHPGFGAHDFAMHDALHAGVGGFHPGFGGFHGGFTHIGMAGHMGGGFHRG